MSSELTVFDKVFASRRILIEMFEYRGYDASTYKQFTKEELQVLMNNNELNMLVEHKTQDRTLYVHYLELSNNTVNTKQIKTVLETLDVESNKSVIKKNTDTVIFVFPDVVSDTSKKLGNEFFDNTGIYIQMFCIKNLMFNVLKHDMVPIHTIMSNEDYVKKVKIPHKIIKPSVLPPILRTDPAAMFIGLKPKEICEVLRPSETAGLSSYYRYCK
jgi:DNA-directed RNA polymerase subunit H (RpoH/RPB5)